MPKVAVGGTFQYLHDGHARLIEKAFENNLPSDLIAIDLNTALYHIGTITGEVTNEEVLHNIFSQFCIGK